MTVAPPLPPGIQGQIIKDSDTGKKYLWIDGAWVELPEPDHRVLLWNLTVKLRRWLRDPRHKKFIEALYDGVDEPWPDFKKEYEAACKALGLDPMEVDNSRRRLTGDGKSPQDHEG